MNNRKEKKVVTEPNWSTLASAQSSQSTVKESATCDKTYENRDLSFHHWLKTLEWNKYFYLSEIYYLVKSIDKEHFIRVLCNTNCVTGS